MTRPIHYNVQYIDENFTIKTRNLFKTLITDIEEKEPEKIANEMKNIISEIAEKYLRKKKSDG